MKDLLYYMKRISTFQFFKLALNYFSNTVEVMIMSHYRYRFGPYVTDRYRFRANVTQRDINVTDCTEFYRYLSYKRYRS